MTESSTFTLPGSHGELVVREWSDPAGGRFAVLLAHGIGEHTGRYAHVAEHLLGHGASLVAGPDHFGHGESAGARADIDDLEAMVADLHLVADRLRSDHPGLPLVLVGHSLGGIIATRFAQTYPGELAALVLSAPVIGGNPGFEALLGMEPMPEVPLDPAALSRDAAVGQAYLDDPLVYHGPILRRTLEAIFDAVTAVAKSGGLGAVPTLWIHGELDPLAPYDVTAPAFHAIAGATHEEKVYPGAMHEIFNETNRDEVLSDVTDFLERHVG